MDNFRVYTGVARVGVAFRFGDDEIQMPSAIAMLSVLVVSTAMAVAAFSGLHNITLGVIVLIMFAVAEGAIVFAVSRLNSMNGRDRRGPKLRETTQVKLLVDNVREPVYLNFATPDIDDGPVYQNF